MEAPSADAAAAGARARSPSALPAASGVSAPSPSSSSFSRTPKASPPLVPVAGGAAACAAAGGTAARRPLLLPSVFEGLPPVLFFGPLPACGAPARPTERVVAAETPDSLQPLFAQGEGVRRYEAVVRVLRYGGVQEASAGEEDLWTLMWTKAVQPGLLRGMRPSQWVNHFPGSWCLGRKDALWRGILRMERRHGKAFRVTPQGYVLPAARAAWEAARARRPDALWIWKPCQQSCGRGIRVLSSTAVNAEAEELGQRRGIVQRYITEPLLLGGYKFDLRIYVVVLSFDPLKAYINEEGLVRLATEKFSASPETLQSRTMHLTNYSVNRASPAFVRNTDGRGDRAASAREEEEEDDEEEARRPSKWSLNELRGHFKQRGLDFWALFERVKDLVVKTLIATEGQMRAEWRKAFEGAPGGGRPGCFEIYGFDVLVDARMKPWLLEVNTCPSLSSSSPLDKRIKTKLVADTLTLVGLTVPGFTPARPSPPTDPAPGACAEQAASAEPGRSAPPAAPASAEADEQGDGDQRRIGAPELEEARGAPSGAAGALDQEGAGGTASGAVAMSPKERTLRLAACDHPLDALPLFDEAAWRLVLAAHDEHMRSGGLGRLYPTPAALLRYAGYLHEETYNNVVLRLWIQAGGASLFRPGSPAEAVLPPWLPRQVCFARV